MNSRAKRASNGFTLSEGLLAFLIAGLLSSLLGMMTQSLKTGFSADDWQQEEFAVVQIRDLCSQAQDLYVDDHVLNLVFSDGEKQMSFHKNRLVCRPGYVIYMEGIEGAEFIQDQGTIWMEIVKDEQKRNYQIC